MRRWVPLLCVDEIGELGWVAKEEHRSVVGNHVPVTLVSAELDREASWVTGTVVRSRLATDGGKPNGNGALLAGLEDVGTGEVVHGIGGLVVSMGTATLCVNNSLWDTLAVKVRDQIDQVKVLKEQRAIVSCTLRLVWVRHWSTVAGSIDGVLRSCVAVLMVAKGEVAVLTGVWLGVGRRGCHFGFVSGKIC